MRKAVLGIRPTDLVAGGQRLHSLVGDVSLVEPIGYVTYLDVDMGHYHVIGVAEPDTAPAAGERVTLGFLPSRVHLFDPESGERL